MQRGLTLAEVSNITGVASSSLSKIENELVSVSYHTLKRICDGLEIPIEEIINPGHDSFAPGRRSLTRKAATSDFDCPQYFYSAHATDLSRKDMIPLMMRIKARSPHDFDEWNKHVGDEFILVISGEIEVHTEFYSPTRMQSGDSMYFDSSMGHKYISISKEDAMILSVCSDPKAHANMDMDDFFRSGKLNVKPVPQPGE
ncbi:MAG: XRE family transcriptional regulator [Pseudomonadota bacterium]|nr:XRE family transcriptional regulator [Pseudomonadota bacterium]